MRSKKELIYLNIRDLTFDEVDALGNMDLNCCDKCGEIDLSEKLNWIDGKDYFDDEIAQHLVKQGIVAICDDCFDKEKTNANT